MVVPDSTDLHCLYGRCVGVHSQGIAGKGRIPRGGAGRRIKGRLHAIHTEAIVSDHFPTVSDCVCTVFSAPSPWWLSFSLSSSPPSTTTPKATEILKQCLGLLSVTALLSFADRLALVPEPSSELNVGQEDHVGKNVQVENVDLEDDPLSDVPDGILVVLNCELP